MTNLEKQMTETLRSKVLDVASIQSELKDLEQQAFTLNQSREARTAGLAHAIGGRDAIAKLWLQEDETIEQSWVDDIRGLRTGGEEGKG